MTQYRFRTIQIPSLKQWLNNKPSPLALKKHEEMLRFPKGRAIYISTGIEKVEEGHTPSAIKRIPVTEVDTELKKKCSQLWLNSILPTLQEREASR